jgi:hypothetical protein
MASRSLSDGAPPILRGGRQDRAKDGDARRRLLASVALCASLAMAATLAASSARADGGAGGTVLLAA